VIHFVLTILCSTIIVVLFKIYSRYEINLLLTIVINYITCVATGLLSDPSMIANLDLFSSPARWHLLALGILFISGFNIVGLTVKYFGMSLAAVFQKLPFIASAGYAIAIYGESAGYLKVTGIVVCVIAVLFSYRPALSQGTDEHRWWHWLLPLLTFLTGATIETTFLTIKKEGLWTGDDFSITTVIFGLAGVLGLFYMLIIMGYQAMSVSGRTHLPSKAETLRSIMAGVILGIPNFYSIYFLVRLFDQGYEGSIIFPLCNIGVLFLSGVIGLLLFREKISLKNALGLILALAGMTFILVGGQ